MKSQTRSIILTALLSALLAGAVTGFTPAAAQAGFGVDKWEAGTCVVTTCTDSGSTSEFYSQAAGHPNFGITDFQFNHKTTGTVEEPEGNVKDVRVDLPPGLSVNPEAVPECTEKQLEESKCPAGSQVGEDEATGTATVVVKLTKTEKFPVYNMVRKPGEPARFGVEIKIEVLGIDERSYLEGGFSWHHEEETSENSGVASGDYHEFFEIRNLPNSPEIVQSKLIFWGVPHEQNASAPDNAFITMPSTCAGPQTTVLHVDSYAEPGHFLKYENQTPIGATGCNLLAFGPSIALTPATTQADQPDGPEIALHVPQTTSEPSKPNSPDVQSAEVTLPEGMTLDPSAAHGLESCSYEQVGLGTDDAIACPAGSKLGTVSVEAPGVPAGALTGSTYLAPQESREPESGREFHIFIAAEAPAYGIGVRLEGQVRANRSTGRLTATVKDAPQVPFENFKLSFNGGPLAPLANPLGCQGGLIEALLFPYSGEAAALTSDPFSSGGCPSPLPFSLGQAASAEPASAGAHSSYSFTLTREAGQQYVSQLTTALPDGLVGLIPSVSPCGEPQASEGTCGAASEIGSATVSAGAGSEPFSFTGPVFLTGPYEGAPFGLSIAVPAAAGPFDLGSGSCDCVVERAAISINPTTARVTVTSDPLTRLVDGVPVRLRSITVDVNRPNFLVNPTSCSPLATESVVTGFVPGSGEAATDGLSSPFALAGCTALPFDPVFSASTSADTSKADGASLETSVAQGPGQSNIRAVSVQLPSQMVTRLSTLEQACTEATYTANPRNCPAASDVGTATATTPVLPGVLSGPAYLVSNGNEAFPNLDILLEGDHVRVVLEGDTDISHGVTTTTFATLPDVPMSSFALELPSGPDSVLTAVAPFCGSPLGMPMTIVAQDGARLTHTITIAVAGCGSSGAQAGGHSRAVRIVKHRLLGDRLLLTVQTFTAGRIRCSGRDLKTVSRRLSRASRITISIPLTRRAMAAFRRHHRLVVHVHVSFVPAQRGIPRSAAAATYHLRPARAHAHG